MDVALAQQYGQLPRIPALGLAFQSPEPPVSAPPRQAIVRTRRAAAEVRRNCDSCVQKKVRCGGGQPCRLCMRKGIKCDYSIKRKPGPKSRREANAVLPSYACRRPRNGAKSAFGEYLQQDTINVSREACAPRPRGPVSSVPPDARSNRLFYGQISHGEFPGRAEVVGPPLPQEKQQQQQQQSYVHPRQFADWQPDEPPGQQQQRSQQQQLQLHHHLHQQQQHVQQQHFSPQMSQQQQLQERRSDEEHVFWPPDTNSNAGWPLPPGEVVLDDTGPQRLRLRDREPSPVWCAMNGYPAEHLHYFEVERLWGGEESGSGPPRAVAYRLPSLQQSLAW